MEYDATPTPKIHNTQLREVESLSVRNTKNMHSSAIQKVIVTGVTGQDGSHMADYLLKNTNAMVYEQCVRRLSVKNHINIEHLKNEPRFQLINLDLTDDYSIRDAIVAIKLTIFLNFASIVC